MTPQHQPNPDPERTWLLRAGTRFPLLEHERPDDRPRRPHMCPVCQKVPERSTDPLYGAER